MGSINEDFTVQQPKSNYTKLPVGKHHLRILGLSVSGYETWEDTAEGGRRPTRYRISDGVPVENADEVKKFLAWPVWNYDQRQIQIFEITQVTIQRELIALERNKKWGDLQDFDIEIERTGNDKNTTKYAVRPEPKTELEDETVQAVAERGLPVLDALFEGADPFNYNGNAPALSKKESAELDDTEFPWEKKTEQNS